MPRWVWGTQTVRLWQARSGNRRTLWWRLRVNWPVRSHLYRIPGSWAGPVETSWGFAPWTGRRRDVLARRWKGADVGADAGWDNSWHWSGSCSWPSGRGVASWLRCWHLRRWTGTGSLHSCTHWIRHDIFPRQWGRCSGQLQRKQKMIYLNRARSPLAVRKLDVWGFWSRLARLA